MESTALINKLKEIEIENLNLKIQLHKYEKEIDYLISLLDISKHIYESSIIYNTRKKKIEELNRVFKENIILRKYFDLYGYGICVLNENLIIEVSNSNFNEIINIKKQPIEKKHIYEILSKPFKIIIPKIEKIKRAKNDEGEKFEIKYKTENNEKYIKVGIYLIIFEGIKKIVISLNDITEQKKLEKQFYQAQKMEAIGRLTSSIAHDFNNILNVILGYSNFILNNIKDQELNKDIEEIIKAAEKGSTLTKQLLIFTRKTDNNIVPLSVNTEISKIEKMIRRLITENIKIEFSLKASKDVVNLCEGELEQIIMNLIINSKDAMPEGGKIKIETYNEFINNNEHIVISVSDTGTGIDEKIKDKIFEPFFTTKEKGKGTGLGLSTVYAIVQKAKGFIDLKTQKNHGTTFLINLPVSNKNLIDTKLENINLGEMDGNGEKILLIEDELDLNKLISRFLSNRNYKVYSATALDDALKILNEINDIQLVILDFILTDCYGDKAITEIRKINPNIKFIISTGYDLEDFNVPKEFDIITKPFKFDKLLYIVKKNIKEKSKFF